MEIDGITYSVGEVQNLVRLALRERERQRKKTASYRKRKIEVPGTILEDVPQKNVDVPGTQQVHKDHQKYNSRYRDDSLDLIEARERVLQRERDGTGIKIPKLI